MGFTDIMCNRVAKEIIDTMFMVNYTPTIDDSKTWYANLNGFLVKEYLRVSNTNDIEKNILESTDNDSPYEPKDINCNTCYKPIMHIYGYYIITHDTKRQENVCDICWEQNKTLLKKREYKSRYYNENGECTIINNDDIADYNSDDDSDYNSDDESEYDFNDELCDDDDDDDDELCDDAVADDLHKNADSFTNLSSKLEDHQSEIFNKVDNDCENVIDELSIVSEQNNKPFTDNEEDTIVSDAFDILCDTLNIDDDEFEEFEHEVDWTRFDDIIHYYIDMLETKFYNTEQFKSNQCEICNTYYNYDTTSVINDIHLIVENKCFECYMK